MQTSKANKALSELNDLLDAEREALLQGDLERLSSLLEPKETLIETMSRNAQTDLPEIRKLDTKLKRNQLLLDGALEGIRAVSARLSELREVKGGLETYDARGRKKDILLDAERSVEHRV